MLYFDKEIEKYESRYSYNESLIYLEKLYELKKDKDILNSLIIYSWYYFIEGPIDSKKYGKEDTTFSLEIWKKYVALVINNKCCDSSTLYFCGYTLSLHGFFLGSEMEIIGIKMIDSALTYCKDENLTKLIMVFKTMNNQKKYKPLKVQSEILNKIFNEKSLVGKYFKELYEL